MIPFSTIPEKQLFYLSKTFQSLGSPLSTFFPLLPTWLKQAEYSYSPREYASMSLTAALFNAVFLLVFVSLISYLIQRDFIVLSFGLALFMFLVSLLSIIFYPAVVSIRRGRQIDYTLINAVRQLLIELRSGVTLFSAMASVAVDYGETSREFKKIVDKLSSGVPELDALAEASAYTPSAGLKKVLWQISNSLKVGSDVSNALDAQLNDLTLERVEQIRKYSQELSPWTMIYMLAAVIFPSLGVAMLIVLSSFFSAGIPSFIFPLILFALVLFQLFFMNLVSTRRPAI